jgi:hypothetical protein
MKKKKVDKITYFCEACEARPKCVIWDYELGISGSFASCGERREGGTGDFGRCGAKLREISVE